MEIHTIRYKSTNYYLIDTGDGILAFDAGWPGTYSTYKDSVRQIGKSMKEIKWLIVSHFHMDHAGLAGVMLKNGIQFVVFRNQMYAIKEMEDLIEGKGIDYTRIDLDKIIQLDLADSRNWLKSIGIEGQVIKMNSHGEQSVTLLLDSGEAFIGDLIPHETLIIENDPLSLSNWKELRSKGAGLIKPAHSEEYNIHGLM